VYRAINDKTKTKKKELFFFFFLRTWGRGQGISVFGVDPCDVETFAAEKRQKKS